MSDYEIFLEDILTSISASRNTNFPEIYHHVRQIPYGGAGQRDPKIVYETNLGSCSGKHILLRDLLRASGFKCQVITIFTHFNKRIPPHASMPDQLIDIITNARVPDFHHFVRIKTTDGRLLNLDATWHDGLLDYGFPVNGGWDGSGDTQLAGFSLKELPLEEDIINQKVQLLSTLNRQETELRKLFLALLSNWFAKLN